MSDTHKPELSIAEKEYAVKAGAAETAGHVPEHIEGNALLVDKQGNVRRLPVPSHNPNDPLNFTTWEKAAIIFCCCWFSLLSLAITSGLGPFLPTFFNLYTPQGYSQSDVTFLLTIPTLCIGLGNFIILPVSLAVGRRPVFLASSLILLATAIGSAVQNSYKAHLATRAVQGLVAGASESLLPLMLTEITFLHQRGRIFGLYWMVQSVFSGVLSISSSYINADLGWRWYYWIYTITIGSGLVLSFFGAFETRFSRPAVSVDGIVVVTDEFGVTHVLPDDEAQEHLESIEAEHAEQAEQTNNNENQAVSARTTYLQKLKPWSTPHPHPWRMIVLAWARMAQCLTSPAILFVVLVSSITLGCTVDMSLTYSEVLLAKGWAAKDIGLINVGAIIAAVIAALYSTIVGEYLVLALARRNHGVHTPEHRLIVLIVPALLGFAMILVYGFTAADHHASSWGPVLSYSFFQVSWVVVLIVTSTFASEAAVKHPGPALVLVVGTKNIVSFGFTYALTPLVQHGGYQYAYGVLAGVFLACFVLGIPVYFLNPRWRAYNARVEQRHGINTTD